MIKVKSVVSSLTSLSLTTYKFLPNIQLTWLTLLVIINSDSNVKDYLLIKFSTSDSCVRKNGTTNAAVHEI
jgi:hypothetical protein